MSKYKVGDKVVIKNDLVDGERYGSQTLVGSMTSHIGKQVVLTSVGEYGQRRDGRI